MTGFDYFLFGTIGIGLACVLGLLLVSFICGHKGSKK